jgi:flagellar motor switch/type III secretory pathway protein FliN
MKVLDFEGSARVCDGRRVRRACLRERSLLPDSAACMVGNAVRETLTTLFGSPANVTVLEPVIPTAEGWRDILRDARITRIRGSFGDAAIALRPRDARVLAAATFGEVDPVERALSPVERVVLDRVVRALVPALTGICGLDPRAQNDAAGAAFVTYFEALVERPHCRIGFALCRDPVPVARGSLALTDLSSARVKIRARLAGVTMAVAEIAALQVGGVVPVAALAGNADLLLGERVVARGACGMRAGSFAVCVEEVPS